MSLATLSIDIVAKLASLEAGMDKAGRITEKTASAIEHRFARVGGGLKTLGGLVGGAFATQQIIAFFRQTVEGLDQLNDAADATGSTVEKISALEDIGARTGTGIDTIEASLVRFNAALKEADGKNGVSEALKAIGLNAAELKRQDPADALMRVSKALQGYADDGDKARLVQELFGKSVREVAPFLKDLADKGELNATVTKEQAAQAEKFNRQLFELQKNVTDAGRAIAGELVPALNELAPKIKELFGGDKSKFTLGTELELLASELGKLKGMRGKGFTVLDFFGSEEDREREISALEARLRSISDKLGAADPGNDALARRLARGEGVQASVGTVNNGTKPENSAKLSNDAQRYLENLQKQYIATLDLSKEEQALADIRAVGFKGLTPELEKMILAQARVLDQDKAATQERKRLNDELDESTEIQRLMSLEMIKYFEDTRTPLEQLNLELARLAVLLQNGMDWETYKRAVAQAQDRFTQAAHQGMKDVDELGEFVRQAARNIQDALGEGVSSVLEGNFKSIGDNFEATVKRMVSQAAAADLSKRLLGDFDKSGQIGGFAGAAGDYLKGLFAPGGTAGNNPSAFTAGGGGGGWGGAIASFASMFAGFFADGGRIAPGKFGVVGEEQAELAFGGNSGLNIVPLGKGGKGAGRTQQINYSPTFVLQAPASRETQEQVAAMAFAAGQEALARSG